MKKNVILKNDGKAIRFSLSSEKNTGDIIIVSHEEILSKLPDLLKTDPMIQMIQNILISGFEKLADVELPIVGEVKLHLNISKQKFENSKNNEIKKFLFSDIENCFSRRTHHCLRAANIGTVYEIAFFRENDLRKFRNFGNKSLCELKSVFEKNNVIPETISLIRSKGDKIGKMAYKNVPGAIDNSSYKELIGLSNSFSFISDKIIGEIINSLYFYSNMFPYRNTNNTNFSETKFEKEFESKDDRKKIERLIEEIQRFLFEFQDTEMRKYINEMKV